MGPYGGRRPTKWGSGGEAPRKGALLAILGPIGPEKCFFKFCRWALSGGPGCARWTLCRVPDGPDPMYGSQVDPRHGSQVDPMYGSQKPYVGSQVDPMYGSQVDPM